MIATRGGVNTGFFQLRPPIVERGLFLDLIKPQKSRAEAREDSLF